MKTRPLSPVCAFALAIFAVPARAADPLPSWNDTAAKRSIVAFVEKVTAKGSPGYVPPAHRIATFDNDGCLWAEQPMYFQVLFAFDRVKSLAPKHPEWNTTEPYKSVLEGDLRGVMAGGMEGVGKIVAASHTDITAEEFAQTARDWLTTARHAEDE